MSLSKKEYWDWKAKLAELRWLLELAKERGEPITAEDIARLERLEQVLEKRAPKDKDEI